MATDPPDERDGDAVREPTAGQHAAFAQLFTAHFEAVVRYARGSVRTREEAQDIAHLVFYRLWTQGVTLDVDRSPLPYLFTLARRAVIDYLRHERIEHQFAARCLQAAELDGPLVAPDDPERELLQQEQSDVVARALDALSSRQREVMVLRWHERLSRADIAQRLGISEKTVAIHLERAKEHLRETLPGMYDLE